MEVLLAHADADRLDYAKLRLTEELAHVDIDVMGDSSHYALPPEASDRAFALARRFAMSTREPLTIIVTTDGSSIAQSVTPVATVAALVALKSVSMPRRSASVHPEKVASDVHDLVRLLEAQDLDDLARALSYVDAELARWIGQTLVRWFSADADQRNTIARLRRLLNALDAQAIDEGVLDVVAILSRTVLDSLPLSRRPSKNHRSPWFVTFLTVTRVSRWDAV